MCVCVRSEMCWLILCFGILRNTTHCFIRSHRNHKSAPKTHISQSPSVKQFLMTVFRFLQSELISVGSVTFTFYIYAFSRRFYPKRLTLHSSYSFTFYQLLLSLGIEPMILALLAPCSTIWATGKVNTLLTLKAHTGTTFKTRSILLFWFLTLKGLQLDCHHYCLAYNVKKLRIFPWFIYEY